MPPRPHSIHTRACRTNGAAPRPAKRVRSAAAGVQVQVRLQLDQLAVVDGMARSAGVSRADVLRSLIPCA